MKTLNIQIIINGNKIATRMEKKGFEDNLSGMFEVIGILDNLCETEKARVQTLYQGVKKE